MLIAGRGASQLSKYSSLKKHKTHTLGKNETYARKHCDAVHTMGVMNLAMVQDAGDARKGAGNSMLCIDIF